MPSVTIDMKFTRGDIVTLKAMVDTPECGSPQRMVVCDWRSHGGYLPNGEPSGNSILYWCRSLWDKRTWTTDSNQACIGSVRLETGESLFNEHELVLYVPPTEKGKDK